MFRAPHLEICLLALLLMVTLIIWLVWLLPGFSTVGKKSVFAVKPQSLQVEGKLETENHHLVDPTGTSPVAQMVKSVPAKQET